MSSADGTSIATFLDMITAIVAKTEVVAGFDQGVDFLAEAYDAFIVFIATFIYVVQLSDVALDFQFL